MQTKPLYRPSESRYLLWWFVLTLVFSTALTWGQIFLNFVGWLSSSNQTEFQIFGICLAPLLGFILALYGLVPGVGHVLLRGTLLKLLASAEESGDEFYGTYRLLNFGYGLIPGFLLAGFVWLLYPDTEIGWLYLGGSALVTGIIGLLVGELMLPKFFEPPKPPPPSPPPRPYPKRELTPPPLIPHTAVPAPRISHTPIPAFVDTETDGVWEYRDFVYLWKHKEWTISTVISSAQVQKMVWDAYQDDISTEW